MFVLAVVPDPVSPELLHAWSLPQEAVAEAVTAFSEFLRCRESQIDDWPRVRYSAHRWVASWLEQHPMHAADLAAAHRRIAEAILEEYAEKWPDSLTEASLYQLRFLLWHLAAAPGMTAELYRVFHSETFARSAHCAALAGLRREVVPLAVLDLLDLLLVLFERHSHWSGATGSRSGILRCKASSLRDLGHPERALEYANAALRLALQCQEDLDETWFLRARSAMAALCLTLQKLGRPEEALVCWRERVRLTKLHFDPEEVAGYLQGLETQRDELLEMIAHRSHLYPVLEQILPEEADLKACLAKIEGLLPDGLGAAGLARLRSSDVVLHSSFSPEAIRRVRLRPVVVRDPGERGDWRWRAREVAESVASFHEREFGPCAAITIELAVDAGEARYEEILRILRGHDRAGLLAALPGIAPLLEGDIILLLHVAVEAYESSSGYGWYSGQHPMAG